MKFGCSEQLGGAYRGQLIGSGDRAAPQQQREGDYDCACAAQRACRCHLLMPCHAFQLERLTLGKGP